MLQQKYFKNLYAVNLKTYPEVKNHYNIKIMSK